MSELRQKEPRVEDRAYLQAIRKLPCSCGCGRPAPSEAAHIRSGSIEYGKRSTGLQEKPHDRWAVPLNNACHKRQHAYGSELLWWRQYKIDPFKLAIRLYAEYGRPDQPNDRRRRPKPAKAAWPRKTSQWPRQPRQMAWPKGRKIVSRGFHSKGRAT